MSAVAVVNDVAVVDIANTLLKAMSPSRVATAFSVGANADVILDVTSRSLDSCVVTVNAPAFSAILSLTLPMTTLNVEAVARLAETDTGLLPCATTVAVVCNDA